MFPIVFLWFMGRRWTQSVFPVQDNNERPENDVACMRSSEAFFQVPAILSSSSYIIEEDIQNASSSDAEKLIASEDVGRVSKLKTAILNKIFKSKNTHSEDPTSIETTTSTRRDVNPTSIETTRTDVQTLQITDVTNDHPMVDYEDNLPYVTEPIDSTWDFEATGESADYDDIDISEDRLDMIIVILREVGRVLSEIRNLVMLLEAGAMAFWQERLELEGRLQAQSLIIARLKDRLADFEKQNGN